MNLGVLLQVFTVAKSLRHLFFLCSPEWDALYINMDMVIAMEAAEVTGMAIPIAIRKMLKPEQKKKTSMSELPLSMFWVISSRVLECLLPLSSSISDRIWSLSIRSVPSFSPSLFCSPLSEFSKIL